MKIIENKRYEVIYPIANKNTILAVGTVIKGSDIECVDDRILDRCFKEFVESKPVDEDKDTKKSDSKKSK